MPGCQSSDQHPGEREYGRKDRHILLPERLSHYTLQPVWCHFRGRLWKKQRRQKTDGCLLPGINFNPCASCVPAHVTPAAGCRDPGRRLSSPRWRPLFLRWVLFFFTDLHYRRFLPFCIYITGLLDQRSAKSVDSFLFCEPRVRPWNGWRRLEVSSLHLWLRRISKRERPGLPHCHHLRRGALFYALMPIVTPDLKSMRFDV